MKGIWLGQAGFCFTAKNGTVIMIDPYLSDSLEKEQGAAYHRAVPVRPEFLCAPDILLITHDHADHMDFGTLDILFARIHKPLVVLAAEKAFWAMRQRYPGKAEFILMIPGTEVTLEEVCFRAMPAAHSDPTAVGFVMEADGVTVWHTGDTLFNRALIEKRPQNIDLLILPINGKGNNMNAVDAARMTRILEPCSVLPMHWDLFPAFGCDVQPFVDLLASDPVQVLTPVHYAEFALQKE